jgi:hypothetical protein
MNTASFWPLDFDTEDEIYENVAWGLPGYRRHHTPTRGHGRKASTHSMPVKPANSASSRVQFP